MAGEDSPVEKLRNLFRDLKPEARAQLMAELERSVLRGQEMPGAARLLKELRESLRAANRLPYPIGDPARLFWAPIEPFLIDESAELAFHGRIARAAVQPMWSWICRDLAPAEASAYCDEATALLLAGETEKADAAARALQDLVITRVAQTLTAVATDDKARRRIAVQVGTPRALEHVNQLVDIFKSRDTLSTIASRLPPRISNLADEQLVSAKN